MAMCWKRSENHTEEAQCADGGPVALPQSCLLHKVFWLSLSASLLLIIFVLGLTWQLGLSQPSSQSSQMVRITVPDEVGIIINQSAVVDQQNNMVTFSVASTANQRATVVFDTKHGLICYKPVHQDSCFLRKMERSDYDNVHSLLQESAHKSQFQLSANDTQRQMEFLGVLAASQVEVSMLEKPLQALCQDRSIHWTRKAKGPGKQRLVYFCIDICFPSNVCVSVCFYYLPE